MKICMVRTSPDVINYHSYNIQELGLAKELLKYNICTDIIMSSGSFNTYRVDECDGVTIYWLPCYKMPGNQGLFLNIFSFLKRNKYDLIQVHDDTQLFSCIVAKWANNRNIPAVLSQGMYQKYKGFLPSLYQRIFDFAFFKLLANSVAIGICKTQHAKNFLKQKSFDKNIVVIPVGLDIDKFEKEIEIDWCSELEFNKDIYILLYVGKIEKRRNIGFLIKVFEEVLKEVNVCLIIAGEGPEKGLYENYVKKARLDEHIKFVGNVPQSKIMSLYKISSLFLLPTTYEIYGMAVLESMYCCVPVIASATAGPLSIITDHEDGIIIKDFNIDDWKREIVYLFKNENIRRTYGLNAGKKIKTILTWKAIAQRYADVYNDLLK
jgi:glycosyltransferase involved in cell wall biosynthesis